MKKISLLVIIAFIFSSCFETAPKDEYAEINGSKHSEELPEATQAEKPELYTPNAPCLEILDFATIMANMSWRHDTARLNKLHLYGKLDRDNVKHFHDKPFYPIRFEESSLYKAYNSGIYEYYFETVDIELFEEVQNIWGYFYRNTEASEWLSDGVIEQWTFANDSSAQKALEEIKPIGSIVYFNTNPYFCRIRNKVIIFQTRAMAFSYDQKTLFEKFTKKYLD